MRFSNQLYATITARDHTRCQISGKPLPVCVGIGGARRYLALKSIAAVAVALLIGMVGSVTHAQVIGDTGSPADAGGRRNLSGAASGSVRVTQPKRPVVRYVPKTAVRVVTVTKIVRVTPTTGTLSVATEPRAVVLVEPIKGGKAAEGTVPADAGQFIFNDLAPGRYRVAAELEGHQSREVEVTVKPNKTEPVTLNLTPIRYQVSFKTNVETGELRYQNLTTGEPPQVVPIREFNVALSGLREGKYDIDIRPADVSFQTLLATITLPGKTNFDVELKRLPSTALFHELWSNLTRWDAPVGWRVDSGRLLVKGRGVALPREENLRHYVNFQLATDVKMLNGLAASFVIRASDPQNYYLIQLTGPNADEPYVLRGFVIKKGVVQRLQAPIPIGAFTSTIKPDQFISVRLTARDNKFEIKIRDNETGEPIVLGILSDPDRNFPIGAVGIASRDNEQYEIWRFIICTPECPKD